MKKTFVTIFVSLLVLSFHAGAQTTFMKAVQKQGLVEVGRKSYMIRCVGCHGDKGDGNGLAAPMLDPKPRDFTKGVFKFKSTSLGDLPTDADLMRVLDLGVVGSSMPSFALLSYSEKQALIEYIKSLAPQVWKNKKENKIIPRLNIPEGVFTKKSEFLKYATRGKMWYQELGCVSCHGHLGDGKGASASTLKNVWGEPLLPANFHKHYVKRGYSVDDIAYSILVGVDGTPMPAHFDVLESLEEKFPEIKQKQYIWELAAYVFYLRGKSLGIYKDEIAPIPETGIPAEEVKAHIGKYLE